MKETVFSVYDYPEIFSRYYTLLAHLEGPSGFPFSIHLDAGNSTEPPTIYVELSESQPDGSEHLVYESYIDQNSPFNKLDYELQRLRDEIEFCIYAIEHQMPYIEARKAVVGERVKKEEVGNSDLPF